MTIYYPQPATWFLQFSIGNVNLTTVPPQYVISFNQHRTFLDAANSFTLSLFYEGVTDLEDLIASQGFGKDLGNVYYRYGIVDGPSTPVFRASAYDYSLNMQGGGTQLDLSGISSGILANSKAYTKAYSSMTIDEVVSQIAKDNNWEIGNIEKCKPILTGRDDITGNVTHKKFYQLNVQPIQFIKEELIPYAISSSTDVGGYFVYFTDQGSGNPKLNFCTPQYIAPPIANYSYYAGPTSNIITWTPEVNSTNNLLQGGGQVKSSSISTYNNVPHVFLQNDITEKSLPIVGDRSFTDTNAAITSLNTSSLQYKEMEARAKTLWTKNANLDYPAVMEVVLDPRIEVNTTCNILIMTAGGQPHYTTGTYLISGVDDTLDQSGALSSVQLIKNRIAKGGIPATGHLVTKPKHSHMPNQVRIIP